MTPCVERTTGRYFRRGDLERAENLVVETAGAFLTGPELGSPVARLRRAELNARRLSYDVLADKFVAATLDLPNAADHLNLGHGRHPDLEDERHPREPVV